MRHRKCAASGLRKFKTVKIVRLAVLCCLLLSSMTVFGQPYLSVLKRFQVDQITGCAPLTVNITSTNLIAGYSCPTCLMRFDPTFSQLNTYTYTYTTPGTYTLSVLYQSILVNPTDDITITVLPNI